MEKKEEDKKEKKVGYFAPIQKGTQKGFTIWQYYRRNTIFLTAVGLLMMLIPLILVKHSVLTYFDDGIQFLMWMGLVIFLVSTVGIIVDWKTFRKQNEK